MLAHPKQNPRFTTAILYVCIYLSFIYSTSYSYMVHILIIVYLYMNKIINYGSIYIPMKINLERVIISVVFKCCM